MRACGSAARRCTAWRNPSHLENLLGLARLGAIVAPPLPASDIRPKSVEDLVDHAIDRALDLVDLDTDLGHRWREAEN